MRFFFAALAFLIIPPAFAQNASRTFTLTNIQQPAALNELATILRTVAGISGVMTDAAKSEITVAGSEADLGLADWLLHHIETPGSTPAEYTLPGSGEVLHIAFLANQVKQIDLNEVVTNLRVNADLQHIFTYTPSSAIAYRSTAARVRMGDWLIKQLDIKADDPHRFDVHEYPVPDRPGQLVKVMFMRTPTPGPELNEIVTTLRVVTDMQRIFTHSSEPRGLVFSSDTAHVRAAEWLVQQLDVQPDAAIRSSLHAYPIDFSAGETIRVYYLNRTDSRQALNQAAVTVREQTNARRIFTCSGPFALALRGTPDVIAAADRVMQQMDR
jgi:hypothetical protein